MELSSETITPPPPMPPLDDSAIHEWLSLTDYSAKYRISVSTLRRRIKTDQIAHRFIDGKYMLLDSRPVELDHSYHQQETLGMTFAAEDLAPMTSTEKSAEASMETLTDAPREPEETRPFEAAPFIEELKHTYTRILQEKEQNIIQLREEISDLHTLVRVLEEDNGRMRRSLGIDLP